MKHKLTYMEAVGVPIRTKQVLIGTPTASFGSYDAYRIHVEAQGREPFEKSSLP